MSSAIHAGGWSIGIAAITPDCEVLLPAALQGFAFEAGDIVRQGFGALQQLGQCRIGTIDDWRLRGFLGRGALDHGDRLDGR